jgi:SAM-dependent methyltransferase
MLSSDAVERACADQFEIAIQLDRNYVHAGDADEYCFGNRARSGMGVLRLISDIEAPTVLDIGAGYGTFLREAMSYRSDELRAIGFTAIQNDWTNGAGIEWVFGDFQRLETWSPDGTIQTGSIDLAVSSLTFQHFAHPLSAMSYAFDSLRVGGHLLIDQFEARIHPDYLAASEIILQDLNSRLGSWGGAVYKDTDSNTVNGEFLHLVKKPEDTPLFEEIEAVVPEGDDRIYYISA